MPEQPERPSPADATPDTAVAEQSEARRRVRAYGTKRRAKITRNAALWVLAIAILQLVFGTWFGWQHRKEADAALEHLATMEATEVVTTSDGEEMTVAALREAVERESMQMLAVPIGLGVVFLGLYFWARKSPIPALSTALGLYVSVIAVVAVVDPASIPRGIIIKFLCILGLVNGVRSALHQRTIDLAEREAAA